MLFRKVARCEFASTYRRWDHSCSSRYLWNSESHNSYRTSCGSSINRISLSQRNERTLSNLPTRLCDARDFPAHGNIAKFAAAQAKLAVYATWPAGKRATIAQTYRARVTRQHLKFYPGGIPLLVGRSGIINDGQ